jgi:hypothetical protein
MVVLTMTVPLCVTFFKNILANVHTAFILISIYCIYGFVFSKLINTITLMNCSKVHHLQQI